MGAAFAKNGDVGKRMKVRKCDVLQSLDRISLKPGLLFLSGEGPYWKTSLNDSMAMCSFFAPPSSRCGLQGSEGSALSHSNPKP